MFLVKVLNVLLFCVIISQVNTIFPIGGTNWLFPHRKGSKFFVRYNSKIQLFWTNPILAYASAYRINYEITTKIPKNPFKHLPNERISTVQRVSTDNRVYANRIGNVDSYANYVQPVNSRVPSFYGYSNVPEDHVYYQHYQFHRSLEDALDHHGFEGRACLARAFCELITIQYQDDIISQLLQVTFKTNEALTCPTEHNCPISIVNIAYSLYNSLSNPDEPNKPS